MGRYVARRLLQMVPVVIGTLFLLHLLTSLAIQFTGDPARAFFGDRTPTESQLQAMRESFQVDDPCLRQVGNPCLGLFGDRLAGMAVGEFGTDFRGRAVTELLGERLPITLRLTVIAFLFVLLVGIVAGVLAGLRKESFTDYLVKISTVIIVSIPIFVIGTLLQLMLGVKLGSWLREQEWLPEFVGQIFTVAYRPSHPWASLVVPGFVLGAISLAYVARLTRTSLMENLRADYVRTATAKGLLRSRVVGVHTLRNSLIPVITFLGIQFGELMGGAIVTEGIFNVPGIGGLVFRSVTRGEAPVVLGVVTILILVYLLANLLVDVLYAVLDPRIRYD